MHYLDAAGAPQGPATADELRAMVAAGALSSATLVWEEGAPEWTPLHQALGLEAPAPAAAAAAAATAEPEEPAERSFVDDDGTRYTWDTARRAFVPDSLAAAAAPEAEFDAQQVMPDFEEEAAPPPPPRRVVMAAVVEEEEDEEEAEDDIEAELRELLDEANAAAAAASGLPLPPPSSRPGPSAALKRSREEAIARETERVAAKREKKANTAQGAAAAGAKPQAPQPNTSVYVTGIPDDATEAEVAAVFSKCGLLREGEGGLPRVKLYRDAESGLLKGDGLVTYLKEPSVALACSILDGAPLRAEEGGALSVTPATFQPKPAGGKGGGGKGGADKPREKKKKGGRGGGGAVPEKALGWDGFDDVVDPRKAVLVLRGLFSPEELLAPTAAQELQADLQSECEKFGPVASVRVFPYHPEGVATVKFKEPESTEACRLRMHGRWFGGKQLRAGLYDGREDFNATRPAGKGKESEAEEAERLERYARELEEQE